MGNPCDAKPTNVISVKALRKIGTKADELRAENRRLRAMLACMVESGQSAAAIVEHGWDMKSGRMMHTFCMPQLDEVSAVSALCNLMTDHGVWAPAKDVAIEAAWRVLKRHGLLGELEKEFDSIRESEQAASKAGSDVSPDEKE